jgi:integrase/recombinase XerC
MSVTDLDRIERIETLAETPPTIDRVLLAWLEALTDSTRETYAADLSAFAAWCGTDERSALSALFGHGTARANAIVLEYRGFLLSNRDASGRTLAPATVSRRLSALRSVSKIARLTGLFSGSIEIPGPKVYRVRDVRGPGPDAYQAIVRALEESIRDHEHDADQRRQWERIRDAAILRLLHDAMLRRVEVVRLDLEDLDRADLRVRPKGPRGAVVTVPIGSRALSCVDRWVRVRGPAAGPLFHSWRVVPTRFAPSTINRIVQHRAESVGYAGVRPHGLRHTAITTALDVSGGDVRAVAALARHANPATTLRYDDRAREAARALQDQIAG